MTDIAPEADRLAAEALARYMAEDYAAAAAGFEAALAQAPGRDDWRDLQERARLNAGAAVSVHVPPLHTLGREEALAPPAPPTLPPRPGKRRMPPLEAALNGLGEGVGLVVGVAMDAAVNVYGRLRGYQGPIWTNWDTRPTIPAALSMAWMRKRVQKVKAAPTYPAGAKIAFQKDGLTPPPGVTHFRTADGSWNNLDNPREGAVNTRFIRQSPADYVNPETGDDLMTPNPREISRRLLTRHGPVKEFPFLNMLAAVWINFMNADWISHGENAADDFHEIPLPEDDPARQKFGQAAIRVRKTRPDPTYGAGGPEPSPITFLNEVTHWWDGSQLYGSDQATQDRVRSHVDGKLTIGEDGLLPLDERGIETTGFTRNWWLGLGMLHTLFVREHNAICDRLKVSYPQWDDARLFNTARLINAAVMAKIHSVEWTPSILPNPTLNTGLNSNWYGLLTHWLRWGRDERTIAPVNVRNTEMGGIVGNPINKRGGFFAFSEEFVEIYRLHSLLPEELVFRSHASGEEIERAPFTSVRQAGSARTAQRIGMTDLLFSFGVQQPGELVLNNYPRFFQELSVPGNPLLDMGALDVLRARERGVPRYNDFRRGLGLKPIGRFEDLTDDAERVANLKAVYGEDGVEKLDLMIGTLGEGHRPAGFGFGETMFQIFIYAATLRLQADRFYTDSYNAETYTQEGLDWIDDVSLKHVLLRHHPELGKTGLANVTGAFEPWDKDERLDPARHPLRAFNPALGSDPWLGDAYRT